jgi:hypothetical protein
MHHADATCVAPDAGASPSVSQLVAAVTELREKLAAARARRQATRRQLEAAWAAQRPPPALTRPGFHVLAFVSELFDF